jgi:hypothetical protein
LKRANEPQSNRNSFLDREIIMNETVTPTSASADLPFYRRPIAIFAIGAAAVIFNPLLNLILVYIIATGPIVLSMWGEKPAPLEEKSKNQVLIGLLIITAGLIFFGTLRTLSRCQ